MKKAMMVVGMLMLFTGMAAVESEKIIVPILLGLIGGALMLIGGHEDAEEEMDSAWDSNSDSRPYFLH